MGQLVPQMPLGPVPKPAPVAMTSMPSTEAPLLASEALAPATAGVPPMHGEGDTQQPRSACATQHLSTSKANKIPRASTVSDPPRDMTVLCGIASKAPETLLQK